MLIWLNSLWPGRKPSLQHYLKEVEKMREEKGVQIEKKTLKGLVNRIESMPAGEVQ